MFTGRTAANLDLPSPTSGEKVAAGRMRGPRLARCPALKLVLRLSTYTTRSDSPWSRPRDTPCQRPGARLSPAAATFASPKPTLSQAFSGFQSSCARSVVHAGHPALLTFFAQALFPPYRMKINTSSCAVNTRSNIVSGYTEA